MNGWMDESKNKTVMNENKHSQDRSNDSDAEN